MSKPVPPTAGPGSPTTLDSVDPAVPTADLISGGGPEPRKAFEFRRGALIPGEIRKDGAFVPEVGGEVIAFADHTYAPDAPRIWNLPGGFVPVDPPAAKK